MSKKREKNKNNSKKYNKQKQTNDTVTPGKSISDSQEYRDTLDIREKRIGIMFKVLYVIAAFFAATFMLVVNASGNGLPATYIVYACVTTFLLCLLFRMIVYIFNELKCLKISSTDVTDTQIGKTEESYSRIFNYFLVGGITSICAAILLRMFREHLTQIILMYPCLIGGFYGTILECLNIKKHVQVWRSISDICWMIAIIAILAVAGLGAAT